MRSESLRSNNKGLSLVELIVAISIGTIVAGSITALIAFAIRFYQNESVNTEMQYEIQTNVNQVMDSIMSSSGVVIDQGTDKTNYAGFGKFIETRDATTGNVTAVDFTGIVLASGARNASGTFDIYMTRVTTPVHVTTAEDTKPAKKAVSSVAESITGATDKRPYLLGQNAKEFKISIETDVAKSSCIVSSTEYVNPLLVDVELEFEKGGSGKMINKKVKDNAIMRNKVTSDIWINNSCFKLKK